MQEWVRGGRLQRLRDPHRVSPRAPGLALRLEDQRSLRQLSCDAGRLQLTSGHLHHRIALLHSEHIEEHLLNLGLLDARLLAQLRRQLLAHLGHLRHRRRARPRAEPRADFLHLGLVVRHAHERDLHHPEVRALHEPALLQMALDVEVACCPPVAKRRRQLDLGRTLRGSHHGDAAAGLGSSEHVLQEPRVRGQRHLRAFTSSNAYRIQGPSAFDRHRALSRAARCATIPHCFILSRREARRFGKRRYGSF
mmetsp:Transcript_15551/g.37027  ORF Transcript_15551/g.37027 Transcript_15551/m.37027 type:complete len:251 (+) Transcript_15551:663-1415(+)